MQVLRNLLLTRAFRFPLWARELVADLPPGTEMLGLGTGVFLWCYALIGGSLRSNREGRGSAEW